MVRTSVYTSGSALLCLAGAAKPHTFLWCYTYLMGNTANFRVRARTELLQKRDLFIRPLLA